MFSRDALHSLATAEAGRPIVSVYARTDPRDPANTSGTPAWLVALHNGLRAISDRLEAGDDRESRLAFRTLRERIETELVNLNPATRARSIAWFLGADGKTSERYSLQLPLRDDAVVWDTRPFVSPLVDIADRGAPVGVILVSGDVVRLVQIEQAEASEPDDPYFELELGDWRRFGGSAGGSPERGTHGTSSHHESYEARVETHREQLFHTAVTHTAKRLEQLGWEHVVLVAETPVLPRFRSQLPAGLSSRIVAESDLNLINADPHAISEALEPLIEAAWLERTTALVETVDQRAKGGGPASVGVKETFGALAEGRVGHLILDPAQDFSAAEGLIPGVNGGVSLLAERAVETAIATGAHVTALQASASQALGDAGGIAALLRY